MRKLTLLAALALAIPALAFVAPEDEKDLEKAKCPVSGAPVKADKTAEYKDATVYFCCDKCPVAFAKDTEKFAAKANGQLVATGQAEQTACPLSGRDLNPDAKITVLGADVNFCCNNCLGKAEAAEEAEQIELVFSEKAFEKAFKVKKKKD